MSRSWRAERASIDRNSSGSRRRKVTPRPSGVDTVAESSRESTNHSACRDGTLRCGTSWWAGLGARRLCSTLRARPFAIATFFVGGFGERLRGERVEVRQRHLGGRVERAAVVVLGALGPDLAQHHRQHGNSASGPARKSRSALVQRGGRVLQQQQGFRSLERVDQQRARVVRPCSAAATSGCGRGSRPASRSCRPSRSTTCARPRRRAASTVGKPCSPARRPYSASSHLMKSGSGSPISSAPSAG